MRTLNLGILAHVDAGKTSLTERLLFAAGVIDSVGRVDDGSTQTDTLALERQRGITIKAAVVSFVLPTMDGDHVAVNLIDTPGHPDFIAEVERVLGVLDGAVLVVSAVEGVQAQTRVLFRTLQRLGIPTLIFVNKIDRRGADAERTLAAIAERLCPAVISLGTAQNEGTREATFVPFGPDDPAFSATLANVVAEHDDELLAAYLDDPDAVPFRRLRAALTDQTRRGLVYPVLAGSTIAGAGVATLIAVLPELLPAVEADSDGPPSGAIFKIERGPAGEKVAYARLFSGTLHVRDRVHLNARNGSVPSVRTARDGHVSASPPRADGDPSDATQNGRHASRDAARGSARDDDRKITAVALFQHGAVVQASSVTAGQIGKLWGLGDAQIGDTFGTPPTIVARHHFAPPTLESVVLPRRTSDAGALHAALAQLAEQDPLINLRQDDTRHELAVSLYGEVQKEVIEATLASEYGIEVAFRETTVICVERPAGTGAAVEYLGKDGNPFCATVGLSVEPAPPGSGLVFRLDAPLAALPLYVYKSIEELTDTMTETVRETLREGLFGWQVMDIAVTMTHSGYVSPSSTAADFRKLTPLVLMAALQQAGAVVCEPIHRLQLEIPPDTLGAVMSALVRARAIVTSQEVRRASYLLVGEIPVAQVHQLQQLVPALTRGEGVLETEFASYQPIITGTAVANGTTARGPSTIPTRPRTDHNPLNRKEYLLHVTRRV